MLLNELLQWATLLFILVVVLGLARQLGVFMQPHHEQLAAAGPEVGDRVSENFVPGPDLERLKELVRMRETDAGLVLVLSELCQGCVSVVEYLERASDVPLPLAVVAKECGPDFTARLGEVFDVVVEDPDGSRVESAGVVATPYAAMVDADGRVTDRAAAVGVYDLVETLVPEPMEPEVVNVPGASRTPAVTSLGVHDVA